MNCGDWEERLALYVGGDVPLAEASAVERHLSECAGCQFFVSGLKEGLVFLKEAHSEPLSPADFTAVRARVLAELEGERRPFWKRVCVYGFLVAAAMLVVMLPVRQAPPIVATVKKNADEGVRSRPGGLPHSSSSSIGSKRSKRVRVRVRPKVETGEPVLIRLVSDNPDVVIYWITDTRGE